jgi:putative MFS transporter
MQRRILLPAPKPPILKHVGKQSFAEILRSPYRRRTIMLTVFNFFQAIAIYGFGNWLPALVNAQNHYVSRSAQVSFLITLAYPLGPLLSSTIAEKYERKWQSRALPWVQPYSGCYSRPTLLPSEWLCSAF